MTRTEIIAKFRAENPEITIRVLPDVTLHSWLIEGNKEVAVKTRCVTADTTFHSIDGTRNYDLTDEIENFYDIDEYPGGGVAYDNDRLDPTTISELDKDEPSWREYAEGTPLKYYLRNGVLWFERTPSTSSKDIEVYSVCMPEDFNNDALTPFNEILILAPFHYVLVLYLQKRAKMTVGKPGEEIKAQQEYDGYVKWMKTELSGMKMKSMNFSIGERS